MSAPAHKGGGDVRNQSCAATSTRRTWHDLSDDEQHRIKRLLTPDPDDNLDDLAYRCERALQIIRGTEPRV